MGSRAWLRFSFEGTLWSVHITDPDEYAPLAGSDAVTIADNAEVHISTSIERSRRLSVLFHELVHVRAANANPELMSAIAGCAERDVRQVEERLASWLGPAFAEILASAGLLKPPKRGP